MRILITGSNGQLGSEIRDLAKTSDYKIGKYKGFVKSTIQSAEESGYHYYNDIVLFNSTLNASRISKTYFDYIWFSACNILDFRWRGWDVTKTVAIIKPNLKESVLNDWGIPRNIEPNQGIIYTNGQRPISELQDWLERKNPHYINCYPTYSSNNHQTARDLFFDKKWMVTSKEF